MSNYITMSTILKRNGWTKKAIDLFYPKPEKEVPNPNYKKAAPMKLYLQSKVSEIEKTQDFLLFVEKNQKRRDGAKKAVSTKIDKLFKYVNDLNIDVPDIPKDELIKKACSHFNARKEYEKEKHQEWAYKNYEEHQMEEDPDFSLAYPDSDIRFLARISTNYLRHNMTDYEKILTQMGGKPGKDDVYDTLKNKVNLSIFNKHEWIKNILTNNDNSHAE